MSFSSWPKAGALLTLSLAALACGGDKVGPEGTVSLIEIAPKSASLYTVGQQIPFTATLTTEAGTAGEGIPIGFKSRDETLVQINSAGIATAKKKGGSTWIVATAGGKSDSALVDVPLTTCGTTPATAMTVGQVVTDVGAPGFCSAASTGDYTVIVHNNSLAASGTSSIEVSGIALGTPPTGGATLSKAAPSALAAFGAQNPTGIRRDVAYEMRHRRAEAITANLYGAGAKTWYDNRRKRATFLTAPPAINDVMPVNVNIGPNGCTETPTVINGRVAAVSTSAIVVTDPGNPTGGYTDAEYNEFAQTFDSIINPLDVAAYGAPSDLDNNGRVVLVFTKAINSRTPAGANYYVGGLTYSRDLLPKSGCAGSNEAELFYLLVPDPSGTASNGNTFFTKTFVSAVTNATVAHEFQHLINFARRRYINPGAPQPNEEVWLNEGLSHMAEELLFYRTSGGYVPRGNFAGTDINNQAIFDSWYNYGLGDFLNFDEYLLSSTATSPFQAGDATGTRGATWYFLRYAADQNFSTDGTFWYNLVNSGEAGVTNLENRLGMNDATFKAMFRDYVVALYTDDLITGIAAKYTMPSWNMRSMYPRINQLFTLNPPWSFPLPGVGLKDSELKSASLQAGGFQVYRFHGITGTDSFIRVTGASAGALPAGITISVIRTQ